MALGTACMLYTAATTCVGIPPWYKHSVRCLPGLASLFGWTLLRGALLAAGSADVRLEERWNVWLLCMGRLCLLGGFTLRTFYSPGLLRLCFALACSLLLYPAISLISRFHSNICACLLLPVCLPTCHSIRSRCAAATERLLLVTSQRYTCQAAKQENFRLFATFRVAARRDRLAYVFATVNGDGCSHAAVCLSAEGRFYCRQRRKTCFGAAATFARYAVRFFRTRFLFFAARLLQQAPHTLLFTNIKRLPCYSRNIIDLI